MDLKTTKEPVFLSEVVYDGQVEQGVEFDYVLPDYYPDIFKVLKCSLTPCVNSYSVSGNQLYCDGVVYIKVLYLGSENGKVNCIEQRYTYSKTIELVKPAEDALVHISPKTDYCNCRAVSGRRIDVRGAVSCKVKVTGVRESQMITGVQGMGAETRKSTLKYCGEKLIASRQFVVREDIETGTGSGGIGSIIHHDTRISVTDYKVVANKVIVKGEALIKALYLKKCEEWGSSELLSPDSGADNAPNNSDNDCSHSMATEVMEAAIPISQIIDLDGISENHVCYVNMSVMDCNLEVKHGDSYSNSSDRDSGLLSCDLTVSCTIAAHLEKEVMPLIDMYSVDYESSFTKTVIKTETMPQIIERQLDLKGSVECNEGNLEAVFDARCDVSNIVCRIRNRPGQTDSEQANADESAPNQSQINHAHDVHSRELVITGLANMQVIGRLDNKSPVFIEKSESFELKCEVASDVPVCETSDFMCPNNFEHNLQVVNTTYSISSDNRVELRVVLKLGGCLYQIRSVEIVKEIAINTDSPKAKDDEYALKLYYAEKNEEIWNIAKRYNTGVDAIIAENDLETDWSDNIVTTPCMLLIPIGGKS